MARFQVVVDVRQLPGSSAHGASVAVKLPGKSGNAGTLYSDRFSGATLANPFTVPAGQNTIVFYMAQPQLVDITVTPSGGAAVALPNILVSHEVPQHQALASPAGKVLNWYLT